MTATRLHKVGCPLAPTAKKVDKETLATLRRHPCQHCFPDFPGVRKVVHRLCTKCRQNRPLPCGHNGGVLVQVSSKPRKGSLNPKRGQRQFWVWPENAYLYK